MARLKGICCKNTEEEACIVRRMNDEKDIDEKNKHILLTPNIRYY